jgi:hypothetical protein
MSLRSLAIPLGALLFSGVLSMAAETQTKRTPTPRADVCSIPLIEVPHQTGRPVADNMPKVPGRSLDRNQLPPPAPPCTADRRIRLNPPGFGFGAPKPRFTPFVPPKIRPDAH